MSAPAAKRRTARAEPRGRRPPVGIGFVLEQNTIFRQGRRERVRDASRPHGQAGAQSLLVRHPVNVDGGR